MAYEFTQIFPGAMGSDDTLRLVIVASRILKQKLNPRDIDHLDISYGEFGYWDLVAPTDLQENLVHKWEDYESFQGKGAQLYSDTMKSVDKALQAGDIAKAKSFMAGDTDPAKRKIDSPLVYAGSERREYSFTIPFMRYLGGAFKDVFEPIHQFKKYSCADMGGTIDAIDFPAIFEVRSSPYDTINLQYGAMTNLQVTYNSPFVGGYPQRAELTITFRDIRPLYRSLWADGKGTVTTGST